MLNGHWEARLLANSPDGLRARRLYSTLPIASDLIRLSRVTLALAVKGNLVLILANLLIFAALAMQLITYYDRCISFKNRD